MATPGRVSHVSAAPPTKKSSGLSFLLALSPLAWLGELLIERTHHRPLAAVTYAALAVLTWVVAELLVRQGLSDEASFPSVGNGSGSTRRPRARLRAASWLVAGVLSSVTIARALLMQG